MNNMAQAREIQAAPAEQGASSAQDASLTFAPIEDRMRFAQELIEENMEALQGCTEK